MLDQQVLRAFPSHTHPLTLVSDPDEVLADATLRAELAGRGFRLLDATDPIALRHAVEQARPWTAEAPLVVATHDELNTLPYDLWQQGHHVTLALNEIFPELSYPVVRALSPRQRRRLSEVWLNAPVAATLSQERTAAYLLDAVFGIGPGSIRQPAELIAWLDDFHLEADPLPPPILSRLQTELQRVPALAGWPLGDLLSDGAAYRAFVRDSWHAALQTREATMTYNLPRLRFAADSALQDMAPRLLRSGTLTPIESAPRGLPVWAQAAAVGRDESAACAQFVTGLDQLASLLAPTQAERDWRAWQEIARLWANLCVLRYDMALFHPIEQLLRFKQIQQPLDDAFLSWLPTAYPRLAALRLPVPRQLYHVPHCLALRREQEPGRRLALLVLDGMALADWLLIGAAWQTRHPAWRMAETLLLAQIPSITAVSRQALIAGQLPKQFADTLLENRHEGKQWSAFWESRGMPQGAAAYARLPTAAEAPFPDAAASGRTQALCLVSGVVDDMLHGTTQGNVALHESLRAWLHADDLEQQRSRWIERLIQDLLDRGYAVSVTSDHGHVAAEGIGEPRDGVTVSSRGRRSRLYNAEGLARLVHGQYPATILWHDDGVLPPETWALVPTGRGAFAPAGQTVVSHGGLTIDEIIVPFVTITES